MADKPRLQTLAALPRVPRCNNSNLCVARSAPHAPQRFAPLAYYRTPATATFWTVPIYPSIPMHVMVATAARPAGCAEAARLQCLGLGHRSYVDLVAVDSLPVRRPRGGFLLASARGPVVAGSSPEPGAAALNNHQRREILLLPSCLYVCRPSRLGSFDSLVSAASPAQIPRYSCSALSCPSHWVAGSLCLFGGVVARPVVANHHLLDRISRNVIGEMGVGRRLFRRLAGASRG
ncbi:uncharacterized protein J3D65DRAFT_600062 [Phyllosticta citribraziliensis]|uniref:Uncharacterized protein n=1 Tax=Phyllosticta citribraziliensis TaxID=989973 RepID=A0ABR1M7N6_9PEZI